MPESQWTDVGSVEELKHQPLQEVACGKTRIALTEEGTHDPLAAAVGTLVHAVLELAAAEPDGLGHELDVLHHHSLLDRHELGHETFEGLDGENALVFRVVVQVPAPAPCESPEARRLERSPLVDDERPGRLGERSRLRSLFGVVHVAYEFSS